MQIPSEHNQPGGRPPLCPVLNRGFCLLKASMTQYDPDGLNLEGSVQIKTDSLIDTNPPNLIHRSNPTTQLRHQNYLSLSLENVRGITAWDVT